MLQYSKEYYEENVYNYRGRLTKIVYNLENKTNKG